MSYLVKLVRDRPPPSLGVTYAPIEDAALADEMLRRKLIEEATEFILSPSLDEAADVLEALRALAYRHLGVSIGTVQEAARRKARERGNFARATGMYVEMDS